MTHKDFLESITLEGEEWRDVIGYEGLYSVSNYGRISSFGRVQIINGGGSGKYHEIVFPPRLLKLHKHKTTNNRQPYLSVMLRDGYRHNRFLVHRIVAEAFISNPNKYPHIDHIDGNPSNNNISNLRWCTPKINASNPIRFKRASKAFKGKYNTKNSKQIVQLLGDVLIQLYPSIKEAGRHGFTTASITRCCIGEMKHHRGFKWMYLSDYETLNQ